MKYFVLFLYILKKLLLCCLIFDELYKMEAQIPCLIVLVDCIGLMLMHGVMILLDFHIMQLV